MAFGAGLPIVRTVGVLPFLRQRILALRKLAGSDGSEEFPVELLCQPVGRVCRLVGY